MKWLVESILLFLAFSTVVSAGQNEIIIDDFENGLTPGWNVHSFTGLNDYRVVEDGSNHVMLAESRATASSLYFEKKIDLELYPLLSWCWKVEAIVPGGNVLSRDSDDYPARIYIVFPHWFYPETHSINYIWANRLPIGEVVPNPFTENSQMVAVQSGDQKVGQWVCEERNVYQDYQNIFGEKPRMVGAIAIMTDSDNTGQSTRAWFDDIRFQSVDQ